MFKAHVYYLASSMSPINNKFEATINTLHTKSLSETLMCMLWSSLALVDRLYPIFLD